MLRGEGNGSGTLHISFSSWNKKPKYCSAGIGQLILKLCCQSVERLFGGNIECKKSCFISEEASRRYDTNHEGAEL